MTTAKTNPSAPTQSDANPETLGSGQMFDAIAGRYDLVNRIMSFGTDHSWRRKTVAALKLGEHPNPHVLDLATGTGDVALEVIRQHPSATVTGADPSEKMLEVGREKVKAAELEQQIKLVTGAAETLPFEDETFDGVTIAFGIRNVSDRPAGLREMLRVAKPGGRVAILELNEPESGWTAPFAKLHIRKIVPLVGGLISGNKEYRYLQNSIAAFPPASEFTQSMRDAGFEIDDVIRITFGVAHVFVGRRPLAS
jgi:demethylmenaquinone methyltransferase / 2-methoxy-6-polyprenyl-1,4-benzoquinol methylase